MTKHFILTNPITRRLYPRFLHFLDGQNIERKLQRSEERRVGKEC